MGDPVQSYDPATKKASTQTVQQVFINHDNDLITVTLHTDAPPKTGKNVLPNSKQHDADMKSHGSLAPPSSTETVHTTQKHPWLTTNKGWVNAGDLQVGDHVQQLDGTTATVTALNIIPGNQDMYDLAVSNVHTFAVGKHHLVVHNCSEVNPEADIAQARSTTIKEAMVKKHGWFFRREVTVGVSIQKSSKGVDTFVTINETALKKWGSRVRGMLNPGETWIEGANNGIKHAEEVLADFASSSKGELRGIGASTKFCGSESRNCAEMLMQKFGRRVLGQR